jgi:hypothetical protein
MRRRVLYDATSRAAAAAAELLRDEFDVAGLSVATLADSADPVVVLVGRDGLGLFPDEAPVRVIALVDADATVRGRRTGTRCSRRA